jgi:hypothetical protein
MSTELTAELRRALFGPALEDEDAAAEPTEDENPAPALTEEEVTNPNQGELLALATMADKAEIDRRFVTLIHPPEDRAE